MRKIAILLSIVFAFSTSGIMSAVTEASQSEVTA